MRINYSALYSPPLSPRFQGKERADGGGLVNMDRVLKMLGHVEPLHIASIINCIPQCYQRQWCHARQQHMNADPPRRNVVVLYTADTHFLDNWS